MKLLDVYGDNPEQIKVSLVALFWLQITMELRRYGLSIETISGIKHSFFCNRPALLEGYLFLSFALKETDFFLIVAPDGRAEVGTRKEIDIAESFGLLEESYIKINFNILKNRILAKKVEIVSQGFSNNFLTPTENSILELIRNGEYQEIILKFSEGEVSHISKKTLEQNPDPVKQLRRLIASSDDFCNITLKKARGKIVALETIVMDKT